MWSRAGMSWHSWASQCCDGCLSSVPPLFDKRQQRSLEIVNLLLRCYHTGGHLVCRCLHLVTHIL